jgi:very-short-patch-repair endonuclease
MVTSSTLWNAPGEQLAAMREADGDARRITGPLGDAIDGVSATASWRRSEADPAVSDEDLAALRPQLETWSSKLSGIAVKLAHYGFPSETQLDDIPDLLRLLTELDSLLQLITSAREVASALGTHFNGPSTNLDAIARSEEFFDGVSASEIPAVLKQWILTEQAPARIRETHAAASELGTRLGQSRGTWNGFSSVGRISPAKWFGNTSDFGEQLLGQIAERCRSALGAQDQFPAWLDYLRAREQVVSDGIERVIALAEQRRIDSSDLSDAFGFVFANSLVHAAFAHHPELAQFSGLSHDSIRKRFAELDRESIELHRRQAAWTISRRLAPIGMGTGPVGTWTELSLLENEISKQRRHIPLRQLMRRAGRALQALKPCFMMGPLSVAQYLMPGAIKFDLVVMDEASQLKPEDALGAIARASQVVVVGDRMQLPPTSFFDRVGEDEEDADEGENVQAVSEAESILDVASTVHKPVRLLRWHYRSRHGSLIAFSNKEFYKSELVAFPSPTAKSPALGVKLIHVRDGVYENRRNLIEAKRVVETAFRHMQARPGETLGIVTLNAPQRELIETLVDERLKSDPSAQKYIESSMAGLEPFFVKNLENVQGDERDVIYISVTYGRSPRGQMFQRFGPINGPTGHRRLNVLFTRARRRVVTFASMTADDIQVQPTSAWGVRALKGYLHYAQTGVLEHALLSGRDPDSDFEVEVAQALRARGYNVVAQVGVAGYYIDLAIKHPSKTDAFILGVECDGATYHSSLSARDRDRLRQSVLEDLGWNIHRIWSTDWFKHPESEINRIITRLAALTADENSQLFLGDSAEVESVDGPVGSDVELTLRSEPDEWEGEAADQPLSVADAQDALLKLRDEIAAVTNRHNAADGLLRDEMLQLLLRTKPATKDDWKRHTPLQLRLDTDGEEVQQYLERVLDVTRRMAR